MQTRIKKGFEITPELHKKFKVATIERDVPMWKAMEEALNAWIEQKGLVVPAYPYDPANESTHEDVEEILSAERREFAEHLEKTIDMIMKSAPLKQNRRKVRARLTEEEMEARSKLLTMMRDKDEATLPTILRLLEIYKPKGNRGEDAAPSTEKEASPKGKGDRRSA